MLKHFFSILQETKMLFQSKVKQQQMLKLYKNFMFPFDHSYNGVNVIKSTRMLRMALGDYYSDMNNSAAFVVGGYVVIPDHFDTLPEVVQWFLMEHEIGHIKFDPKHTSSTDALMRDRLKYIKRGEIQPNELRADMYAVSQLGIDRCVDALTLLKRLSYNDVRGLTQLELDLRIKAIQTR
jgi:hypothetical protein